jgi:ribosome-associated translation inhibitor RaiA
METNAISNENVNMDRELQAYFYQQLAKLEPYVVEGSRISFQKLRPHKSKPKTAKAQVRLLYQSPAMELKADGQGDTMYEASAMATEKMIGALAELTDAAAPASRASIVRAMHQPFLH